ADVEPASDYNQFGFRRGFRHCRTPFLMYCYWAWRGHGLNGRFASYAPRKREYRFAPSIAWRARGACPLLAAAHRDRACAYRTHASVSGDATWSDPNLSPLRLP